MTDPETPPDLSVVVPVYNDPGGIRTTVSSLAEQSLELDRYEVLVIDNASNDETRVTIQDLCREHAHVEGLHEGSVQSSYAARNAGIREAEGDVLAFVDANVTLEPRWLEVGLDALRTDGVDYLGTDVEVTTPADGKTLVARYNRHTGFPVRQYVERHRYAPTCALFVDRTVFDDVGLFDPRLVSAGDLEFGNRVDDFGYQLAFHSGVTAYHPSRVSMAALWEKYVRVGRGQAQIQRYYPERYGRPPVPPRHPRIETSSDGLLRRDRASFAALSATMAAARGVGYFHELVKPTETGSGVSGPPTIP